MDILNVSSEVTSFFKKSDFINNINEDGFYEAKEKVYDILKENGIFKVMPIYYKKNIKERGFSVFVVLKEGMVECIGTEKTLMLAITKTSEHYRNFEGGLIKHAIESLKKGSQKRKGYLNTSEDMVDLLNHYSIGIPVNNYKIVKDKWNRVFIEEDSDPLVGMSDYKILYHNLSYDKGSEILEMENKYYQELESLEYKQEELEYIKKRIERLEADVLIFQKNTESVRESLQSKINSMGLKRQQEL